MNEYVRLNSGMYYATTHTSVLLVLLETSILLILISLFKMDILKQHHTYKRQAGTQLVNL